MNDYYEQIGDYINGSLAGEELTAFQKALDQDVDLQKAVDNHPIVERSLELLIEEDIRGVIGKIDIPTEAPEEVKAYGARNYVIGLLIAILLGIGAFLYNQNQEVNPEVLYAQFYSDYISPEVRGNETKDLSLCDQGHSLLQNSNYSAAKTIFQKGITINDRCNDKSQWYLSLIYLREDSIAEAKKLLGQIINEPDNIYRTKAQELLQLLE